jgi:hypothetical protein
LFISSAKNEVRHSGALTCLAGDLVKPVKLRLRGDQVAWQPS